MAGARRTQRTGGWEVACDGSARCHDDSDPTPVGGQTMIDRYSRSGMECCVASYGRGNPRAIAGCRPWRRWHAAMGSTCSPPGGNDPRRDGGGRSCSGNVQNTALRVASCGRPQDCAMTGCRDRHGARGVRGPRNPLCGSSGSIGYTFRGITTKKLLVASSASERDHTWGLSPIPCKYTHPRDRDALRSGGSRVTASR